MPPDGHSEGGRDRHVRDVTAPHFPLTSSAVFVKFPAPCAVSPITPSSSPSGHDGHPHPLSAAAAASQNRLVHPNQSAPLMAVYNNKKHSAVYSSSGRPNPSPLLTPCSSSDSLSLASAPSSRHNTPAILATIFPHGMQDVEAIHDILTQLPNALKGAIVDRHSGVRSLYILGLTSAVSTDCPIRDIVVRVLDLADEEIEADQVIFALEKDHQQCRELLQGLLYVGGTVVKNAQHNSINNRLVLVGIEI